MPPPLVYPLPAQVVLEPKESQRVTFSLSSAQHMLTHVRITFTPGIDRVL